MKNKILFLLILVIAFIPIASFADCTTSELENYRREIEKINIEVEQDKEYVNMNEYIDSDKKIVSDGSYFKISRGALSDDYSLKLSDGYNVYMLDSMGTYINGISANVVYNVEISNDKCSTPIRKFDFIIPVFTNNKIVNISTSNNKKVNPLTIIMFILIILLVALIIIIKHVKKNKSQEV